MDDEQKQLVEELLFSEEEKPSLAKMLFFGALDKGISFPFPYPDPQEEAKNQKELERLRSIVKNVIDADAIDRAHEIPQSVIRALGDSGFLGAIAPKEYGGIGLSQYGYCQCMEEIAKACGATAVFVNAHQSIGLKAILLFGNEWQKKEYLPSLVKGEELAAFSLTEPNAGSDAAGIETVASYDAQRKVYVLNGRKQWTTNGSIASVLTVMAKTSHGDQQKVSAFIVKSHQKGFKVTHPGLEKVGIRGTKTANLEFDHLEVEEKNVLGDLGKGLRVCLTVLDYGRITFGATCTGISKDLKSRAIYHAKNRIQFKKSLSQFPLIKKKIAKISSLSYAMNATTYLTAGIIDRGEEDVMLEAAILKVFASEALWDIIYETMQIYGGRSFFTDQPLERMMRDARLNMIGEGANEVLRAFIAAVGMREVGLYLQKHFFKEGKFDWKDGKLWKKLLKEVARRWKLPSIPIHYDQYFYTQSLMIRQCIRKFGLHVLYLLGRYKEGIVDEQLQLDRIASVIISLYTSLATLSKIDTDIVRAHGKVEGLEEDIKNAQYYISNSIRMANRFLKGIHKNDDNAMQNLSDFITKE